MIEFHGLFNEIKRAFGLETYYEKTTTGEYFQRYCQKIVDGTYTDKDYNQFYEEKLRNTKLDEIIPDDVKRKFAASFWNQVIKYYDEHAELKKV